MPEWDPETDVGPERARELIAAQFPELSEAPIEPLARGWDNTVFLVDGRWAFRFPRREIAVAGVHRELDVLGRLAPHLPLPIPTPAFVGAPTDGYPWPWFGAAYLPGEELAASGLADEARVGLAAALGGFLRALHAPGVASRIGGSMPVDPMRRTDMAFRTVQTRARLQVLVDGRLWEPSDEVDALLDDASRIPPPSRTVMLHGDLHVRHVLVDPAGAATGVIDWGDVCVGDPSADLAIAYGAFAGEARDALLAAYGAVDGLTELRARVIACFLAAALLAYADDQRMAPLRAEALRSLERVVS